MAFFLGNIISADSAFLLLEDDDSSGDGLVEDVFNFKKDERGIWTLFFFLVFPSTLLEGIAAGLASSSGGDFNSTFKGDAFLL